LFQKVEHFNDEGLALLLGNKGLELICVIFSKIFFVRWEVFDKVGIINVSYFKQEFLDQDQIIVSEV
jgi:hypothetical protein